MIAKPLTMNYLHVTKSELTTAADQARDLDLLLRIADKDEAALKELYAAHGQHLYAYALRLTEDPVQAEDVVQDVLVTVWRTAGAYRGDGRPISWMLGIVHNLALKSQRRGSIQITEEMETNLRSTEPLPEEQVQTIQQAEWLRNGLQHLSPEHRAVLELVFYQGLSIEETAGICGCPVGTVKSRLSYARQQLRGWLNRTEVNR